MHIKHFLINAILFRTSQRFIKYIISLPEFLLFSVAVVVFFLSLFSPPKTLGSLNGNY